MPGPGRRRVVVQGFALLEVLVALAIMAMSLGALYQAAGGGVKGVHEAEQRVRALTFARSLLDSLSVVPQGGFDESGVEGGMRWRLSTLPFPTGKEQAPGWALYRVEAVVAWGEGRQSKEIRLASLLPERTTLTERRQ